MVLEAKPVYCVLYRKAFSHEKAPADEPGLLRCISEMDCDHMAGGPGPLEQSLEYDCGGGRGFKFYPGIVFILYKCNRLIVRVVKVTK